MQIYSIWSFYSCIFIKFKNYVLAKNFKHIFMEVFIYFCCGPGHKPENDPSSH